MNGAVPAELKLLGIAVVIGLVQLLWATAVARRDQDPKWVLGAQDDKKPLGVQAARLDRAFRNFMETFPLFATAVIVADLMGKFGALTLWGSGLYVAARALYAPLYASGVPVARTLVWLIGSIGLLLVVVALFR
ncbi:MAPEG family protein [Phenylobacterium sp. LjRoot219]|uniref:MAPEG family protein n=1 Tax=Phenylobacterium sp. LjRoot219 TaxID=3342283 RepID=UPI003ECC54A3